MNAPSDHPAPRRWDPPSSFPVHWEDPADAALWWTHETEHASPLVLPCQVAQRQWIGDGMVHAARLYGAPLAGRRGRRINTYWYDAMVPMDVAPEERDRLAREGEALKAERARSLQAWWEERWRPELDRLLDYWAAQDPDALDDGALARWLEHSDAPQRRIWAIHFELVFCLFPTLRAFDEQCRELFGSDSDPITGQELLVGEENATLRGAMALWDVSRQLLEDPAALEALAAPTGAAALAQLQATPAGQRVAAALSEWLAQYGRRPDERREALGANWDEDPSVPLAMLRAYVQATSPHPLEAWQRRRAQRDARTAEARQRLTDYPAAVRASFEDLLARARYAARLAEDHNFHLDQKSFYWYRRAVIAAGRRLAARGSLERPEDVVFLTFPAIVAALATGEPAAEVLRAQVAAEKVELDRWADVDPPEHLGTEPPEDAAAAPAPPPHSEGPWQGVPASPGIVRGRARVALSLGDASAAEPGDILVTTTTNPAWSPLFAVLGGLVTTVGSSLSHGAIVAREFGLPAVVAVAGATTHIRTGDWLELDGARGTVTPLNAPAAG